MNWTIVNWERNLCESFKHLEPPKHEYEKPIRKTIPNSDQSTPNTYEKFVTCCRLWKIATNMYWVSIGYILDLLTQKLFNRNETSTSDKYCIKSIDWPLRWHNSSFNFIYENYFSFFYCFYFLLRMIYDRCRIHENYEQCCALLDRVS